MHELKEIIEEKKFAEVEDDATVAKWSKVYESEIEKADQDIELLEEKMKNMDDEARAHGINCKHKKNVAFENIGRVRQCKKSQKALDY